MDSRCATKIPKQLSIATISRGIMYHGSSQSPLDPMVMPEFVMRDRGQNAELRNVAKLESCCYQF